MSLDSKDTSLQQVIMLRRRGDLLRACLMMNSLLGALPLREELLAEAAKLELLQGNPSASFVIFNRLLSCEDFSAHLEATWFVRLYIELGESIPDSLKSYVDEAQWGWLGEWAESGADPLYQAEIIAVPPSSFTGPINYNLTLNCPACGHSFRERLNTNLLVRKIILCPDCFARLEYSFQSLRAFLSADGRLDSEPLTDIDLMLLKLLRRMSDPRESRKLPTLIRYLNQDYLYHLTHNFYSSPAYSGV